MYPLQDIDKRYLFKVEVYKRAMFLRRCWYAALPYAMRTNNQNASYGLSQFGFVGELILNSILHKL